MGNIPTRWSDPYGRGLGDWVLTGMWNPPPGVTDAATDEFARSTYDRSLGTADAVVSNASAGVVRSVGGQAFDESNRQAASETAGTIITTAQTVANVGSLAGHIAGGGIKAALGAAEDAAGEFASEADSVIEGAEALESGAAEGGAEAAGKETGSYTNHHESGNKYHGKGDRARSQLSGKRKAAEYGDPHVATDWTPAKNSREAFRDEARRLERDGGPQNPGNYNKIESPGKKYRNDGCGG